MTGAEVGAGKDCRRDSATRHWRGDLLARSPGRCWYKATSGVRIAQDTELGTISARLLYLQYAKTLTVACVSYMLLCFRS